MCTPKKGISRKSDSNMTKFINSVCSRTWSQACRIGVLLWSIKPPLSVWGCVRKISMYAKDAFKCFPLLYHAIPGSAVVRGICRLDGRRSTSSVLKFLRYAYKFPQESDFTSDFSESEYGEDSIISRESTPLPTSIPEFEDHDIHSTSQKDASKFEDEAAPSRPQQWIDHSKSEAVRSCSPPLQLALGVDNEASSHGPQESYDYDEDFADDGQQDDEALGVDSPEPRQVSPYYQLCPKFDADRQGDEPLKTDNPEPLKLFPIHQFHSISFDAPQFASETRGFCPKPIRNYPTHKAILQPELFGDWYVDMSEPMLDEAAVSSELFEDWQLGLSEPIFSDEAFSRKNFPARHDTPYPGFDDDEKEDDDESIEGT